MHNLNKVSIFIFLVFTFVSHLFGQNAKTTSNFFEIQKNFYNTYSANKNADEREEGEEDEYTQFKRWEWYWQQRIYKDGSFPSNSITYREWVKYVNTHPQALLKATAGGTWSSLELTTSNGGYEGIGRVSDVAFHPTDANTMWVGTPAGGIWKTTNGGTNWTTNTDNLPVMGVSSIAIDHTNPNIMYIATGDGNRGSLYPDGDTRSIGVMKSINGGVTWDTTGLSFDVTDRKLMRKLALNPDDTQNLLVASTNGIYRSIDGGGTFNLVQVGEFVDVVFNEADGNYVYATSYGFNNQGQIWRSINAGATWTQVTTFTGIARVQVAVSPANPTLVQAIAAKYDGSFGGIYTSTDNGYTFTETYNNAANLLGYEADGSDAAGQGTYDLCIGISPTNPNEVYVGGINVWKSTDGGVSWACMTYWNSDNPANPLSVMHADQHRIAFNPNNGNLVMANDGGVYVKAGNTITDKSNTLEITQFYSVSTAQTVPNLVLGGAQDNSCKILENGVWSMFRPTGDGMRVIIDPIDETTLYVCGPQGMITRVDNTTGDTNISANLPSGQQQGSWITPYTLNPMNHNTIYAGYSEVYKSTNKGDTWTAISNGGFAGTTVTILKVAPSDSTVIYAATDYNLFVTTNEGATWTDVSANLPAGVVGYISDIAIHPSSPNILWISSKGYTAGEKIFYSSDNGSSWSNTSGTLPNLPVTCIIYQRNSLDALYIGTDVGVFYTNDTLPDWEPFGTDLPNVIVNALDIQYNTGKLIAGTFGRGMWEIDADMVLGIDQPVIESQPFTVYPNPNNGTFNLKGTFLKLGDKATLYNYIGQPIKTIVLQGQETTIQMNEFGAGVYFLGIDIANSHKLSKVLKIK